MKSSNVFEASASELEKLQSRARELFREKNKGPEHALAWSDAVLAFHEAYDRLAFPGGLNRQFELLKVGDVTAIEMAVRFLEANPWFFRSGYYKADILRLLRKHPLSDDQCGRIRKVILERVLERPVREMRIYARFAPRVSNPQFEAEVQNIADNAGGHAARHAQWVLDCVRSAKGKS